jgi:peptidoglycan hydrolase-like protein with peptidoglycan-binding domain
MRASITSIFLAALVSLGAIPLFASALTFTRPLAYGSSGTDVSALQQYLKDQGYFHYPDITGYFGPYTWRAIAAFQWDNKLESVGYLGPKTELALNKLLDQSLASLATSTSAATPSSSPPAIPSLVSLPPPAPIYTTPPPTPAIGQPWHAPSGGGYAGGPPAAIPEPAPPPAPAPYVAKAVYFDGSTWLSTNNLSSTDNSFFSFSFWFKTSTVADAIIFWISDPNNYLNGFGYQRNGVNPAGNSLEFTLGNPTLGSVGYDSFSMDPPENVGTPFGSWHHAIGSFWGNNSGQIGAVKLYIDDIDVSPPQSWPIPNNPPGSVAYNTNIFGG